VVWSQPSTGEIDAIVLNSKRLAIVGASSDPGRASNQVLKYLLDQGCFEISPINPNEKSILGLKSLSSLKKISTKIDVVIVFRRSEAIKELLPEILALRPRVLWLQLGIRDDDSSVIANQSGISVVQDRCFKIEYARAKHSAQDSFRPINLAQSEPFRWHGVHEHIYKADDGPATFKGVSRRKLFVESAESGIELRYFEIAPGGHTTLEKHDHMHLVIPIRGRGSCLVENQIFELSINDMIHVPSWAWHQFRAAEDEFLGFLCLVKVDRDRPTLPDEKDLELMRQDAQVAQFIREKQTGN
jgi:predicted CoA-binding protein/quercetin dioxygenase-like cupin family protein